MARVTNVNETKVTIIMMPVIWQIPAVDDGAITAGPALKLREEIKVTNAAHFEEIPRRKLGISQYEKNSPA